MIRSVALLLLLPAIAACDAIPRDVEGTSERVRAQGWMRVGVIASGSDRPTAGLQRALILRVAQAAGARPVLETGSAELLLAGLERGELDLVVGEFDPGSPWTRRVHFLTPLLDYREDGVDSRVTGAARHGENGWIMLLERQARALSRES